MTPLPMVEVALGYARAGWRVFPLFPIVGGQLVDGKLINGHCGCSKGVACTTKPGKHPRIKAWQKPRPRTRRRSGAIGLNGPTRASASPRARGAASSWSMWTAGGRRMACRGASRERRVARNGAGLDGA